MQQENSGKRRLKLLGNDFYAMAIKVVRRTTSISEAVSKLNSMGFRSKYHTKIYRAMVIDALATHEVDYVSIQNRNKINKVIALKQEKVKKQSDYNETLEIIKDMYDDGVNLIDIKKTLNDLGVKTKFGCVWTVPRCFIALNSNHIAINRRMEDDQRYELNLLNRIKIIQEIHNWRLTQSELITLLNMEGFTRPNGKRITKNYLSNLTRLKSRK